MSLVVCACVHWVALFPRESLKVMKESGMCSDNLSVRRVMGGGSFSL